MTLTLPTLKEEKPEETKEKLFLTLSDFSNLNWELSDNTLKKEWTTMSKEWTEIDWILLKNKKIIEIN